MLEEPLCLVDGSGAMLAASPALTELIDHADGEPKTLPAVLDALVRRSRDPENAREQLRTMDVDGVAHIAMDDGRRLSVRADVLADADGHATTLWRFSESREGNTEVWPVIGFLEEVDDIVGIVDRGWRVVYANPAALRLVVEVGETALGKNLWEAFPMLIGTKFYEEYRWSMAEGVSRSFTDEFLGRRLRVTTYPARDGLMIWGQDVTHEAAAVDVADPRTDLMRTFAEATVGLSLVRADGTFAEVNQAYCELVGHERDELIGTSIVDVIDPEDLDRALGELARLADDGGVVENLKMRVVRKDGSRRWVEANGAVLEPDGSGERFIVGHARDIDDQMRTMELLEQREKRYELAFQRERAISERLRALDEMKDVFLTSVSHDLRTPLSAVIGFAGTLFEHADDLDADTRDELTERLWRNAQKLHRLLGDLLDLDRLQRGIVEPARRKVDVAKLVRGCAEEFEPATEHRIELELDPIQAEVDPAMIERVAENLLNNAAKHTPAGATIWVSVKERSSWVELVVEDDGPGIPDESKAMIFEAFAQGPSGRGPTPGVGIGLSLVARFVALHDGTVTVEDRPGGGVRFTVRLPLGAGARA